MDRNGVDYAAVLNPAQLEAVLHLAGPALVIAGAGSGKTRTLIYRVARLVEEGIPPEKILLLTFTRKASQEMVERASSLADARCRFVSSGTFHSLALQILRRHAEALGFSNFFTILDRSDMEEIIQSLVPEIEKPKSRSRFPKRNTIANILSKSANLQQSMDQFLTEEYIQFQDCLPQLQTLERLYSEYKREHQLMDFDDLIINLRSLLADNPDVRVQLSQQYSYLMVDEYQDTNLIQADIVRWLAHEHKNIMVVGDDSQSIYSFRGANYRNMFEFTEHFQDVKIIKLEENFRSSQPILTLTNGIMEQASEQFTKCLFTNRVGGERPRAIDTRTEPEQSMFITRYIKEKIRGGQSLKDIAVLFRAGYHSFELEAELTRNGIKYMKYGGFKFLESAHIKDFLAHLRVVVNENEAVSWMRILRLVNNVGVAKGKSIIKWMRDNHGPLGRLGDWPGIGKNLQGLKQLAELLSIFDSNDINDINPQEAFKQVMAYYTPILKEKYDDSPRRQKELDQLLQIAGRYQNMENFLDDLVMEPPTSSEDLGFDKKEECLTLSTVHSAKGLEWPVVFIIWAMEGRFPSAKAYHNALEMEEERRLMYVAATRAMDELILCYPSKESLPGWQYEIPYSQTGLSSFIRGLPGDILQYEKVGGVRKKKETYFKSPDSDYSLDTPGIMNFSQGMRVRHPAFGPGVVSKIVEDKKIEVLFRNAGRKLLHIAYTTLEKI